MRRPGGVISNERAIGKNRKTVFEKFLFIGEFPPRTIVNSARRWQFSPQTPSAFTPDREARPFNSIRLIIIKIGHDTCLKCKMEGRTRLEYFPARGERSDGRTYANPGASSSSSSSSSSPSPSSFLLRSTVKIHQRTLPTGCSPPESPRSVHLPTRNGILIDFEFYLASLGDTIRRNQRQERKAFLSHADVGICMYVPRFPLRRGSDSKTFLVIRSGIASPALVCVVVGD